MKLVPSGSVVAASKTSVREHSSRRESSTGSARTRVLVEVRVSFPSLPVKEGGEGCRELFRSISNLDWHTLKLRWASDRSVDD